MLAVVVVVAADCSWLPWIFDFCVCEAAARSIKCDGANSPATMTANLFSSVSSGNPPATGGACTATCMQNACLLCPLQQFDR